MLFKSVYVSSLVQVTFLCGVQFSVKIACQNFTSAIPGFMLILIKIDRSQLLFNHQWKLLPEQSICKTANQLPANRAPITATVLHDVSAL